MFQDQPLFGGAMTGQRETPTKVAVLGTTALEQRSVVFANYNRQDFADDSKPSRPGHASYYGLTQFLDLPYKFLRSSVPSDDMKVWES